MFKWKVQVGFDFTDMQVVQIVRASNPREVRLLIKEIFGTSGWVMGLDKMSC